MKRILTIVGARPQFIKAAAISHTIRNNYSNLLCEDILHTGQHYNDAMSGRFFTELDIPLPRYNLGVGSDTHGAQTAAMLNGIEAILLSEHYDGVLVYGDTNSTLAGALAAAKLRIPVYHVEAGLRSFNRTMPEELNRIVTDHISSLLFTPTQTATQNLWNEGLRKENIILCGDVMYDNTIHYAPIALNTVKLRIQPSNFIFVTLHRDFNTDNTERLNNILSALNTISEYYKTDILFPLHPRTRKAFDSMNLTSISNLIHFTEPFSYMETLAALHHSRIVLTDSGGVQKEANFCGKSCVILRPETEWIELVESGSAMIADADKERIIQATEKLIDKKITPTHLFGDGNAAEIIVKKIVTT